MTHAAESRAESLESTQLKHRACAHTYTVGLISSPSPEIFQHYSAEQTGCGLRSAMCTSEALWSTKVSSKQGFSQRPKPGVTHHNASCGCTNAEAAELELSGCKLLFSMWANIHSRWVLKVFTVWECWHRVPSVGVAVRQPWHCDNAFPSTLLTFDGWIRKKMKVPNSTQGLNLHKGRGGRCYEESWFIICVSDCDSSMAVGYAHILYAIPVWLCQNVIWCVLRWERRIRTIPAKSRGCQCLIRASPPPYYFASKSESVPLPTHKSWLHSHWLIQINSKRQPNKPQHVAAYLVVNDTSIWCWRRVDRRLGTSDWRCCPRWPWHPWICWRSWRGLGREKANQDWSFQLN